MLKAMLLCFVVLAIAQSHSLQKRQIGACIEACSTNTLLKAVGLASCPAGYVCKSNGCGHTCQKETISSGAIFGTCVELCENGCPEGYECRSNGCGHTCQKIVT